MTIVEYNSYLLTYEYFRQRWEECMMERFCLKKYAAMCEEAEKPPARTKSYLQNVTYWEAFIPGNSQSPSSGSPH